MGWSQTYVSEVLVDGTVLLYVHVHVNTCTMYVCVRHFSGFFFNLAVVQCRSMYIRSRPPVSIFL